MDQRRALATLRIADRKGSWPKQQDHAPAPAAHPAYTVVERTRGRWWEVRGPRGELVCVTVYKRAAVEVVRRLAA